MIIKLILNIYWVPIFRKKPSFFGLIILRCGKLSSEMSSIMTITIQIKFNLYFLSEVVLTQVSFCNDQKKIRHNYRKRIVKLKQVIG